MGGTTVVDVNNTVEDSGAEIVEEGHSEGYTAILFILVAVLAGCAIQLCSSRYFKNLPFSPSVFTFGILLAVLDRFGLEEGNQMHESIQRWESIDGHLLLNIFLPPLLMADSIHLDWHVARRSAAQCLLLAFPGVVLGAFLTALVATHILPYQWGTELAWSFGAVLAATDPVAVVSLLKELGAPASLTMIITGESLLNDGSSIVIWRYFFDLHLGFRTLEAGSLISFMLQLALGGAALGLGFGLISLYCLSLASHKLEHTDVIVQVVLTIVLSYLCFYIAENVVNVSGVLAVCTQGTFLSATFWPIVASRQTMEHVWHTVEWMYTTLLFTLAGLIVGSFLVTIDTNCSDEKFETADETGSLCLSDLPWVLVTYVLVIIIRFITIFALLPLLRRLGYGLSVPGVLVCTWGGLRGAVGLALALSMHVDLGGSRTGKLVVLQVAGIALLTLLVNAPLSPALLNYLRLTKPTETKRRLLLDIERRVHAYALDLYLELVKKDEWKLRSPAWEAKLVDSITSLSKAVDERAKMEKLQVGKHSKLSKVELHSLMLIAEEHAERAKKNKLSTGPRSMAEKTYSALHLPNLHAYFPHSHLRAPHLHLELPHLDPDKFPQLRMPHLPSIPTVRSRQSSKESSKKPYLPVRAHRGNTKEMKDDLSCSDHIARTPHGHLLTKGSVSISLPSARSSEHFDPIMVVDVASSPRAAPFDFSGNGVIDSVGFDTNNDGEIDTVGFDTTGDGYVDAIGFDTNGDGQIDTMQFLESHLQASAASSSPRDSATPRDSVNRSLTCTPLLSALKNVGAIPLDFSGDGFVDSVGFDINGDGKVDVIGFDTTGDGLLDSVGFDTNGDGLVDTIQPITSSFEPHAYSDVSRHRNHKSPNVHAHAAPEGTNAAQPDKLLLTEAMMLAQAIPIDYSGDGVIDSVGFDTNGDGNVDLVCFDTTGDGRLDTFGFDTSGDGRVDTLKPIPTSLDLESLANIAETFHVSTRSPRSQHEPESSARSSNGSQKGKSPYQTPFLHAQSPFQSPLLQNSEMDHSRGKAPLQTLPEVNSSRSGPAVGAEQHMNLDMMLPPPFSMPGSIAPTKSPEGSFKIREKRRCSAAAIMHAAEHAMGLDYDQAAHIVDSRLTVRAPRARRYVSDEINQTSTEQDMHEAATRVQAALRGRHGRQQIEHQKKQVHTHRLLHVRFIFLHVLKHVYNSFVEDGIVPARSLLAHNLINSVDMAVDHLGLPLFDWAVIVQEVIRLPWYKRLFLPKDSILKSDSAGFGTPAPVDAQADAWDGVRLHNPGSMLGLASALASKVRRRHWYHVLPSCLHRIVSWLLWIAGSLAITLRLDSLFLRLNLSEYDEHAVYVLRCFILAHQEAQRELRANLAGENADVRSEVVEVVQESQLAVHEARRYLRQLTAVSEQRGIVDLVDSVRSRQLAGLILSRLEAFVRRMMERGALDETDAQHLMHEFAQDEERIQRKGAKMFVPTDETEKSQRMAPTHSHAHAVAELQRIHLSGAKRIQQLQMLTKATAAFRNAPQKDSVDEMSKSQRAGKEPSCQKSSPVITRRMMSALKTTMPMSIIPMAVKHDSLAKPEKSQHVNELDGAMLRMASRHTNTAGASLLSHRHAQCSYTGAATPGQRTPQGMRTPNRQLTPKKLAGLSSPELPATNPPMFALPPLATARNSSRLCYNSPSTGSKFVSPMLAPKRWPEPIVPTVGYCGTSISFGGEYPFAGDVHTGSPAPLKRHRSFGL